MDWVTSAILGFGFVAALLIVVWVLVPKGWRTLAFNVASGASIAIAPILDHLAHVPWHEVVDKKTAFFIVQGLVFANVALRAVTNTPMGKRG